VHGDPELFHDFIKHHRSGGSKKNRGNDHRFECTDGREEENRNRIEREMCSIVTGPQARCRVERTLRGIQGVGDHDVEGPVPEPVDRLHPGLPQVYREQVLDVEEKRHERQERGENHHGNDDEIRSKFGRLQEITLH